MITRRQNDNGFNLIESAIVLGVVGLVIGGIWVAAASVSENTKVNNTINGAAITANNIQRIISGADAAAMPEYITSELANAGAFPGDWISGSSIKNPFNGDVVIKNHDGVFDVRLSDIPRSACIKLASRLTSLPGSGLNTISFLPANWGTTTLPMTSALATTICADGNNDVWLTYDYRRVN